MIFTYAIAVLAVLGSVSASPTKFAEIDEPIPTVTESKPGCYVVSLETPKGIASGETCGPKKPIIEKTKDGCFTFTTGDDEGVLCPDGTARSGTSAVAKRSVRPEVQKVGNNCYVVTLASVEGKINSTICGPHEPVIKELKDDCFSATIDNNEVSLCLDGRVASSTSQVAGRDE
ncbi:hypothetical protein BKA69DRAFT_1174548 [Paraphysoderma sedebokerense]|nr:hypothetical protein BKA69DRAFT_1174548 [Paraphysoderma sedebokerense]